MRTIDEMIEAYGAEIAGRIVAICRQVVASESMRLHATRMEVRKAYLNRRNMACHCLFILVHADPDADFAEDFNTTFNYARSVVANADLIETRIGGF